MKTTNWRSCLALLFAGTLALTGCSSSGSGKDGAPGAPGAPGEPGGCDNIPYGASKGVNVKVSGVTEVAGAIQVQFTLEDDAGFPVDITGKCSVNVPMVPKFSLSYLSKDANGQELPLTVLTKRGSTTTPDAPGNPTTYDTSGKYRGADTIAQGTLTQGPASGEYTYTFPSTDLSGPDKGLYRGVQFAADTRNNTHVLWIEVTRQTNLEDTDDALSFTAKNQAFYFVPATGAASDERREIASNASCSNCHAGFKPEAKVSEAFHGGSRNDVAYCEVCHNPARTSNPAADSMVFVHRIHASEELTNSANLFHGIEIGYPQDVRNCAGCHAGAAQGDQAKSRPSAQACSSCHDAVNFATGDNHGGGKQDDTACATCHKSDDTVVMPDTSTKRQHLPVAAPAADSVYAGGTNANTNAAYLAAAGQVPAGAIAFSYDVKEVRLDSQHPTIVFKLKQSVGGAAPTDVVFKNCPASSADATQEVLDNFVGSPSVYFAYALPQDNISAPADFNASASGYIRNLCNATATTGSITYDAASGYYTATLTATVPATATMLTGGVGYTYALNKADPTKDTQPLTQTNVAGFPYDTTTKIGGLIVPVQNVWKTATGMIARRPIVATAKCNACHAAMGVTPTFHAGQRNDGPTCSFCHTPNRNSGGWSANAKDFIHAVHAGRVRTVPYTWHASAKTDKTSTAATTGFQNGVACTTTAPCNCTTAVCYDNVSDYRDVEFPSRLNNCEACHSAGTYDFTANWYKDGSNVQHTNAEAIPNLLWSTEAAGLSAAPDFYVASPYLKGVTYPIPAGWTASAAAAAGALVTSPITAACVRCHDSASDIAHFRATGGSFYAPRPAAGALPAQAESCLVCHGHGKDYDISRVHMGK